MAKERRTKIPKKTLHQLEDEYRELEPLATDFAAEVVRQLNELLEQKNVSLAVPIEFRVKTWSSIAQKLERRELTITSLNQLHDLIGVRAILLFRRDVETVCTVIQKGFTILSSEDTIKRLGESQFGYSSMHYIIQIPKGWLSVPSLARFDGLKAELQVRTVAQHLWAATSHVLQYKQEENVPPPVRRSMYRVSALLETIDLEFERVLIDRENYKQSVGPQSTQERLNVDLLAKVLAAILPANNRAATENFAQLLSELFAFGISTPEALTKILAKHKAAVLRMDRQQAMEYSEDQTLTGEMAQRKKHGVFFTWAGLVRMSFDIEFGPQWRQFLIAKHVSIEELGLPQEIPSLLTKLGIGYISDLAAKTTDELRQYPGVTAHHIAQIEERLKHYGLSLGTPTDVAALALANTSLVLKRMTPSSPSQR